MTKSRTVESLQVKRAEIADAVAAYEAKLHQARADLAHITAAIAIFESSGDRKAMDANDKVLAKTVGHKVVYVMRAQEKRKIIRRAGICLWASP